MRRARVSFSIAAALALSTLNSAAFAADPPLRASEPVPDPGKSLVSGDDASAIAVNPANLAFLPSWELRWNWVRTGSASPLPARGHSIGLGIPIFNLATGLRIDLLDPPDAAPAPFDTTYHWIRWDLAARAGESAAIGTTFGWGGSSQPSLDGMFSITSGITLRPSPWISLAATARDWNEPESKTHSRVERSWAFGGGFRPFGRRSLELDLEAAFFETSKVWVPRAVAGLDVPHLGRVRADITANDLGGTTPRFVATAGLDLNFDHLQVSGGGIFGDALTRSGTGFYAGAAIRGFEENGINKPAHVAKITLNATPGVRGHFRLLRRLWRLAADPEVEGVVLNLHAEPATSVAHAEEVADAIRMLRANGKKVLCQLEDAGGRSLHVCSQANRIAMNPAGGMRFSGVSAQYYYFGGLFKKLGVRADFVRIGAHKLAAEQLTLDKGSDVAEKDHQELVDEMARLMLYEVASGRRIPLDELKKRIAKGPFIATEARDAGLVDVLAYEDEIGRVVEEMLGRRARVYDDEPSRRAPKRWGDAPKIAVVYLNGDMVDGESTYVPFINIKTAGSRTMAKALKRAREDESIRAVVFRVETGGGSSLAADVMLREELLTARAKPFLVSMGSTAASGGYYASMAGRGVWALPATVTGSIGIFYGKVDVVGLLDKLGVHFDQYRSSPRADAESFFRPFTDDERAELGVKVKQFYDTFIGRVSEGRHMTPAAVDAVARGRVWTGEQASKIGLVDHLGGFREVLIEARKLGHLPDDAQIVELPDEDDSILGVLLGLAGIKAAGAQAGVGALIPSAVLPVARAMAPFFLFEPEKAMARSEFQQDTGPDEEESSLGEP
jgi:protease-4